MANNKKYTNNAGEGVEKKEPSCTAGRNINSYNYYGEHYGGSFKKLNIELPYDPAIPLLCTNLEKTILPKDICTPMLTAALFTMAKTWKHLISTDRGMDKEDVVHVYSELSLSHKKN